MFPTTSGKKLSVHIETLGCRLNQIESEGAADSFSKSGFVVTMHPVCAKDSADENVCVCILNTCAVTSKAEQKARRTIRLLLEKFPKAVLIVTGCYAQLSPKEIESIDSRVVVLPGLLKSALSKIPSKLKEAGNSQHPTDFIAENIRKTFSGITAEGFAVEPFKLAPKNLIAHSRASIKIQDGCNNNCSYCAIHLARGKSVSLDAAEVVERVKALESAGHNEVVLTGVNIGQYNALHNGKKIDIADLLELILSETKNIAVRFSSIYPETVTPKFCAIIRSARVRPHFHLSVQSGSDAILKKMNRHYTRKDVIAACRRLKKAKKNPFLACDIITGFPGETQEDFFETLDLLKTADFVNVHAFPFSPRPKTAAFAYKPKIPERLKDERVKALNEFSAEQKINYINSFRQKTLRAIAEKNRSTRSAPQGKKTLHAVTENFIHAEILVEKDFAEPKEGEALQIKIIGAQEEKIRAGGEWEAIAEFSNL